MATAVSVEEVCVEVADVPRYFLGLEVGTKTVRFTSFELVGKTIDEAQVMVCMQIGNSVIRPVLNGEEIPPPARATTILQAGDKLRLRDP